MFCRFFFFIAALLITQTTTAQLFWDEQIVSNQVVDASFLHSVDLDGDVGVLPASENDDKIAWYENLGGGIFPNRDL